MVRCNCVLLLVLFVAVTLELGTCQRLACVCGNFGCSIFNNLTSTLVLARERDLSDLLEGQRSTKAGSRYVKAVNGERCATIRGITRMPGWCADSWDIRPMVSASDINLLAILNFYS